MRLGIALALKSIWRHRLPHIVAGAAIVSVLTPLMLLYGVKTGVVDGLVANLKHDPRVLVLSVRGNVSLKPEAVDRIRAMPETLYAIGATRSIASRLEFELAPRSPRGYFAADVVPTSAGDPLLKAAGVDALGDGQVVLSQGLADKLDAKAGSRVTGRNTRNDGTEQIAFPFEVKAVLPGSYLAGDRAVATEAILQKLEAFLDGYAVPSMGISGRPAETRVPTVESMRVYARTIGGVVVLNRALEKLGFMVSSNASQISLVQNLDRVMTGLFLIVASVATVGFIASFWASLASVFEQYRRHMSLLKLLGLGGAGLAAFPIVQAIVIASAAVIVSIALFLVVGAVINRVFTFGYVEGDVCILHAGHYIAAAVATYLLSVAVSLQLAGSLHRISPGEAVRDT
jgi:putative ABC transport system permease protein